ncbi:MAG TPA: glycine cleavage system aminomethyltransferase GcvT [Desulfonatronum sp.]|nr:glycine cleavage system aminomethyltransferase GcvT [Desulfonatronum sp.]
MNKRTPLHDWHVEHQARMVPFAGWDMPVQYSGGILAEHEHTRTKASLFDICHMGEFIISGTNTEQALSRVVTHNLENLRQGKSRYGFLLNTQGGILDDLIMYRLEAETFMAVVNASRRDSDLLWLLEHLPPSVKVEDVSGCTAKIDLQGPLSIDVLSRVLPENWRDLGYFSFRHSLFQGQKILISRTGYTGELGYEVYLPSPLAEAFWEACLADGTAVPAGLGARDTLRLEMGYPLYGHDLDEEHTPAEAGYSAMLTSKADYIGKDRQHLVRERLTPLNIDGRRSARHNDVVTTSSGETAGHVTSGSFAPSLGHCVALAYILDHFSREDTFIVQTGKTGLPAKRAALPFYNRGSARMRLE